MFFIAWTLQGIPPDGSLKHLKIRRLLVCPIENVLKSIRRPRIFRCFRLFSKGVSGSCHLVCHATRAITRAMRTDSKPHFPMLLPCLAKQLMRMSSDGVLLSHAKACFLYEQGFFFIFNFLSCSISF